MEQKAFRDDHHTHKHTLPQRIPILLPSEAPDYQNDGESKNILRKYFMFLFCLNFSRPFLASVGEKKASDWSRMTNVCESALQQDTTAISPNIWLSYTSSVWSDKAFSRCIHSHKWCLFSYWSLWELNGWLLFVNMKTSHHYPSCKFCNSKLPWLPDMLANCSLQSFQTHSRVQTSGRKTQILQNRHTGFCFIPSCVPDPKIEKLWVHLMIFGSPGTCVTREVDVCVQMAISWDKRSYIHSWKYLQDMTSRRWFKPVNLILQGICHTRCRAFGSCSGQVLKATY